MYEDCIYLRKGFCIAQIIELDPDEGCMTYSDDPEDLKTKLTEEDIDEFEEDSWEDAGFEELSDLDYDEGY